MKEELLKGLSEEQIAKLRACKSQEEMLTIAKQEGVKLMNEQLEAVNGGNCSTAVPDRCYKCGHDGISSAGSDGTHKLYRCNSCGLVYKNNNVLESRYFGQSHLP